MKAVWYPNLKVKKGDVRTVKKIRPSNTSIYLKIFFGALLISIATRWFIIFAGVYSAGLSGVSQGASYLLWDTWGQYAFDPSKQTVFENIAFWLFNILLNIPILIFSLKRFGKKFLVYSLLAFTISAAIGIGFAAIPYDFFSLTSINQDTVAIVSAVIGGAILGIGAGLIFSVGGSALGVDPISKHLQRKYLINISIGLTIFTLANSLVWMSINGAVNGTITSFDTFMQETIFSISFLCTIMLLAVYSITIAFVYPSLRRFSVSINSLNKDKIIQKLKETNFNRGFTIFNVTGGFSEKERDMVQIVINSEELYDLLEIISSADSSAFISITEIKRIYGDFTDFKESQGYSSQQKKDIKKQTKKIKIKKQKKAESKKLKEDIKSEKSD